MYISNDGEEDITLYLFPERLAYFVLIGLNIILIGFVIRNMILIHRWHINFPKADYYEM